MAKPYGGLFAEGNTSGVHYFPATALTLLKQDGAVKETALSLTVEGPIIKLEVADIGELPPDVDPIDPALFPAIYNILIATENRPSRDDTKDKLVISIEDLAALTETQQDALALVEMLPKGFVPRVTNV